MFPHQHPSFGLMTGLPLWQGDKHLITNLPVFFVQSFFFYIWRTVEHCHSPTAPIKYIQHGRNVIPVLTNIEHLQLLELLSRQIISPMACVPASLLHCACEQLKPSPSLFAERLAAWSEKGRSVLFMNNFQRMTGQSIGTDCSINSPMSRVTSQIHNRCPFLKPTVPWAQLINELIWKCKGFAVPHQYTKVMLKKCGKSQINWLFIRCIGIDWRPSPTWFVTQLSQ